MLNLSKGEYVEAFVKDLFEDIFFGSFREATEEEDRFQGTDFYLDDIPIDVTINPDKNYSKFIKKYMLEGITVNVLKRFGNGRQTFNRPVLVFHFELYDLRNRFLICELIEENLTRDIVSDILGLYA